MVINYRNIMMMVVNAIIISSFFFYRRDAGLLPATITFVASLIGLVLGETKGPRTYMTIHAIIALTCYFIYYITKIF